MQCRTYKESFQSWARSAKTRRNQPIDVDEIRNFNDGRRRVMSEGGLGMGQLAARGLLATAFGGVLAGIVATPANADEALDIQILQTASSLEILADTTYGAALKLPFISGNKTVAAFATMTMKQHGEHNLAFQAQAKALGGKAQTMPNAKYLKVVNDTKPMLTDAAKVVTLATALETVATETYLKNLSLLGDTTSKTIFATVMGVETPASCDAASGWRVAGCEHCRVDRHPDQPRQAPRSSRQRGVPPAIRADHDGEPARRRSGQVTDTNTPLTPDEMKQAVTRPNRRDFLIGTGGLAAAGFLAACGSDKKSSTAKTTTTGAGSVDTPAPESSTTAPAGGAAGDLKIGASRRVSKCSR